jgi:hypothetical protein
MFHLAILPLWKHHRVYLTQTKTMVTSPHDEILWNYYHMFAPSLPNFIICTRLHMYVVMD